MVKQISVFLENKEGRLAEVTKVMGRNGVNIRALSIADTTDFGILRLIVSDPETAVAALREADFTTSVLDVLAIGITDEPGSLSQALGLLQENGIVIEYMYAFCGKSDDKALVILKVSDIEKAAKVLSGGGISVMAAEDVYCI